jgi:hypothetical protein
VIPLPKTPVSTSSVTSVTAGIIAAVAAMVATAGASIYQPSPLGDQKSTPISRCDKGGIPNQRVREDDCDNGFRIESHLMDRIGQKKYLASARDQIPSTFRVLAIDIKEMRTDAFTGICRLSSDKVFLEEVAPPKEVNLPVNQSDAASETNEKTTQRTKVKIPQKALVKSIFHCSSPQSQQQFGVELLEASVMDLNPHKLRKQQSIGTWEYDPGKYYQSKSKDGDNKSGQEQSNEQIMDSIVPLETKSPMEVNPTFIEMEAPWNQYAWMEELRLRINGQVHFDAPMEKSSVYERVLFGHCYKTTVPTVHKFTDFFIPFSFAKSNPDGVDTRQQTNVRACNKPHAVIANGAALQLVRSAYLVNIGYVALFLLTFLSISV